MLATVPKIKTNLLASENKVIYDKDGLVISVEVAGTMHNLFIP